MKSPTLAVPLLSRWLKHGAGTLFIYFADEIIWNLIICIIICKWIIWRQHEKKQRQSPGVEGFCGKLEGRMRKILWNVHWCVVRGKRGESRQMSQTPWTAALQEEESCRQIGEGDKGCQSWVLGGMICEALWWKCVFFTGGQREEVRKKKRLKTELDWKSSRIHLQTKKVGGMIGREESGVKDGLFLKGHLYCEVKHLEEIEKERY